MYSDADHIIDMINFFNDFKNIFYVNTTIYKGLSMIATNTKKTDWSIALDNIIQNKCKNIKDEIINSLIFLEENYHAGISYKITGVPDLRFLTHLGKNRHFFLIKSSCEIHLYLTNPSLTLKRYPFLHDKGSLKNHYQIKSFDVKS